MKTEKEIRDQILADWGKNQTRDEIKPRLPLDIHLAVMQECINQSIDCPVAWAEVEKVVQEPDDDFWIWCMGEAWKMTGEPARVNICSTLLMKELGIKIGREALLKAYQDGR